MNQKNQIKKICSNRNFRYWNWNGQADLNKIFEPFYQSQDTNTKAGGTGIGLSYTRSLVKLLEVKLQLSKLGKWE